MSDELLHRISRELGEVNAKQDMQLKIQHDHSKRLTSIENYMERRKGAKSVFVLLWGFMLGIVGLK